MKRSWRDFDSLKV